MEHYMQYELQDLMPCIKRLSEIFTAAEKHPQQALREKYKDAKYDCVSKIAPPTSFPFDAMDADSTEECWRQYGPKTQYQKFTQFISKVSAMVLSRGYSHSPPRWVIERLVFTSTLEIECYLSLPKCIPFYYTECF